MDQKIPDTGNPDYDELPEGIKAMYSLDQYLWLSDTEKAVLIQTETEPDHEE